jgi:hypothetical protein
MDQGRIWRWREEEDEPVLNRTGPSAYKRPRTPVQFISFLPFLSLPPLLLSLRLLSSATCRPEKTTGVLSDAVAGVSAATSELKLHGFLKFFMLLGRPLRPKSRNGIRFLQILMDRPRSTFKLYGFGFLELLQNFWYETLTCFVFYTDDESKLWLRN